MAIELSKEARARPSPRSSAGSRTSATSASAISRPARCWVFFLEEIGPSVYNQAVARRRSGCCSASVSSTSRCTRTNSATGARWTLPPEKGARAEHAGHPPDARPPGRERDALRPRAARMPACRWAATACRRAAGAAGGRAGDRGATTSTPCWRPACSTASNTASCSTRPSRCSGATPTSMGRMRALLLPKVQAKDGPPPVPENRRLARRCSRTPATARTGAARRAGDRRGADLQRPRGAAEGRFRDHERRRVAPGAALLAQLKLAFEPHADAPQPPRRHPGRPDWRATLQGHGPPWRRAVGPALARSRRTRPAPLVLLADISGSMSRYSRMLLHFGHAAGPADARVESFVFGTRLTRTTRLLKSRDPDLAVSPGGACGGGLVGRHAHHHQPARVQPALGAPRAVGQRHRAADHRRPRAWRHRRALASRWSACTRAAGG
jgi:hypothetical protein